MSVFTRLFTRLNNIITLSWAKGELRRLGTPATPWVERVPLTAASMQCLDCGEHGACLCEVDERWLQEEEGGGMSDQEFYAWEDEREMLAAERAEYADYHYNKDREHAVDDMCREWEGSLEG